MAGRIKASLAGFNINIEKIEIPYGEYFYFLADGNTDDEDNGNWRIGLSNTDIIFEYRQDDAWVEKRDR